VTSSDLAKYSMTRSTTLSFCDSWASCLCNARNDSNTSYGDSSTEFTKLAENITFTTMSFTVNWLQRHPTCNRLG